ncbi:hypothetical protein SAMD00079811_74050 [Scytonema sp. HK-05]|nr:hypothetical protein NIES2130_30625 [Scytonema sp. HK-05]BAY49776.1 hypothetical protein SAMD00079811_74050 [Scytonema sp. HK-05]
MGKGYKPSLELKLVGADFEIFCDRCLVRGWWLNPFAAELGSNYDVTVRLQAASNEVWSKIIALLKSKYPCRKIA